MSRDIAGSKCSTPIVAGGSQRSWRRRDAGRWAALIRWPDASEDWREYNEQIIRPCGASAAEPESISAEPTVLQTPSDNALTCVNRGGKTDAWSLMARPSISCF